MPTNGKRSCRLLRTTVLDDVSHIVIKYLVKVVDAPSFVLFTGQDGKLRVWAKSRNDAELDPHEMTVAQWSMINGKMAGAGTETLANAKTCFLPMKIGRRRRRPDRRPLRVQESPRGPATSPGGDREPDGAGSNTLGEGVMPMGHDKRLAGCLKISEIR